MKKVVLFIVSMLMATTVFAEKVVGTYTMAETSKDIEAAFDNKGVLKVFIEVLGEYKNDKVMIKIDGEQDLNEFIAQLKYCKAKFIEWDKVAKANNVTDYTKKYDVTFPNIEVWWRGSKWFSTFKRNLFKPIFMVGDDGKSSFGVGGKATDWDNEYIDQQWYLILMSSAEFDSLINALNPEKIKSALKQGENADALFQ